MSENLNLSACSANPGEVYWRDPAQYTPPTGRKVLLLTEGGVAVIGLWHKGGGFVAWSPLPKRGEKKVMIKNSKWTTDDICAAVFYALMLALIVIFFAVAFRAAWKEKEAKALGQGECAAIRARGQE